MRHTYDNPWEVYKRVVKKSEAGKKEKYCFAKAYGEKPVPKLLTQCINMDISF